MEATAEPLDFRLTTPQSKAFRLIRRPRIDVNLEWGRGCGKSWFDRFLAWTWVAEADGVPRLELLERLGVLDQLDEDQRHKARSLKGIRIIFLMPTLKQFSDIHGRLIKQENADEWRFLGGSYNGTTHQIDFPGGSWIAPFPASEHGSKRALGLRGDIVICDEADDIDPSVFDTVVRPWFSEPWSLKIRGTSGTPRRGRYGLLYQRKVAGEDPQRPRYHSIHATYADNPEIVDWEEVEDARKNSPKATFEREWECNFDAGEGLVYAFDPDFHVRKPPLLESFNEFHVGVDHGWVDPGVMLLAGIQGHGADATVWLLQEWYETECPNHVWTERAKAWASFSKFWPDPSRPDRIRDLRVAGCDVGKTDNDILGGVARVADLLAIRTTEAGSNYARLYVAPECKNTIREFGVYRRKKDPQNADQFLEAIEDKNNHTMDALRYLCVGRFGRGSGGRHVASGR